ncbi:MAG: type II secretion system F family protein [Burkholderiaceae bacterium]|nr:type II secretion system F family protein [Burkholderiaceae bacterium]
MDIAFALSLLVGFLAVVLLLEGAFLLWSDFRSPEVMRLERRLQALSAGSHGGSAASLMKKRSMDGASAFERLLVRLPRISTLDRLVEQSGTTMTLPRLVLMMLLSGVSVFLVGLVFKVPTLIALFAGVGVATVPPLFLLLARDRRLQKLDAQLPEAVDLIARALRAGHAFPSALQMAGEELPLPIADEFRITFDETNYGVPMGDALMNLATRVPSDDLRFFVIAVLLQRETGGNLAEILNNIATLIRERFKLMGTVRVLSAEGKLSAWILTLLPFGAAFMISIINPGFMSVLWTDPSGFKLASGAGVLMVLGIFWMWRIIKIRV